VRTPKVDQVGCFRLELKHNGVIVAEAAQLLRTARRGWRATSSGAGLAMSTGILGRRALPLGNQVPIRDNANMVAATNSPIAVAISVSEFLNSGTESCNPRRDLLSDLIIVHDLRCAVFADEDNLEIGLELPGRDVMDVSTCRAGNVSPIIFHSFGPSVAGVAIPTVRAQHLCRLHDFTQTLVSPTMDTVFTQELEGRARERG
jgi:hypothetical protein